MKRFAASILLLLYFVVSTGFVISVHFCMDKLDAVRLGHVTTDACNKCGMSILDNDGCCKDEVKVVKMQVDQLVAELVKADFSLSFIPSSPTRFLFVSPVNSLEIAEPVAHGPPLSEQDTYLQNRVFRI